MPNYRRNRIQSLKTSKYTAFCCRENAKLNGLEPYRYPRHIFTELPKAQTLADIEQLLPWAVDHAYINGLM